MSEIRDQTHYKAFLSYSHRDAKIAQWVHQRLESFRTGADLGGQPSGSGHIPARLRPIFRDRSEFSAGDELAVQTAAALGQSAALVVLASPDAARSRYVHQEILQFRQNHPSRPVIPLIVRGPAHLTDADVFPPSLRFEIDGNGALTDIPMDILAADLREMGDGVNLAMAKVVARLLGLGTDQVFRRAERERRRQQRVRTAVGACILVLCAGIGLTTWHGMETQRSLAKMNSEVSDISRLTEELMGIGSADAAEADQLENVRQAITEISQKGGKDARYAKAFALLKAHKTAEAEQLLESVAEDAKARLERDRKQAAAAYRDLGAIAGIREPARARAAYAEAAALDPDDVHIQSRYGYFESHADDLATAEAAFRRVIDLGVPGKDDVDLYSAWLDLGDLDLKRGQASVALQRFIRATAIVERLLRAHPDGSRWQRDFALCYRQIGEALVAEGNLPAALTADRSGMRIMGRVVKLNPDETLWQRDLELAYISVGDIWLAMGSPSSARNQFRDALEIADKLLTSDTAHMGWQLDKSKVLLKIGGVEEASGNMPSATQYFSDALAIADKLSASDPGNAKYRLHLAACKLKIGNLALKQRHPTSAAASYQFAQEIFLALAKSDPGNVYWQLEVASGYLKLGRAAIALGQWQDALTFYVYAENVFGRLADTEPSNAENQYNLARALKGVARASARLGLVGDERAALQKGQSIAKHLSQISPDNVLWEKDLAWFTNASPGSDQ